MPENPEELMFEYLLVFDIPKGDFYSSAVLLNKRIQERSTLVREKFYYPHLTALLTCLHESKERQFIEFLKQVASTISPFDVTPSSIEGFDYNSVVYVAVNDKEPFTAIVKKLRSKLKRCS